MTILLNGGSNPAAITYNGTSLDKVIYNGTTVWTKRPPAPDTIDVVGVFGTNFNLWLRNLTRQTANGEDSQLIYITSNFETGTGTVIARYYGVPYTATEASFELKVRDWSLAAANSDRVATSKLMSGVETLRSESETYTTGIPEGFEFGQTGRILYLPHVFRVQKQESAVITTENLSRSVMLGAVWYGDMQSQPRVGTSTADFAIYHNGDSIFGNADGSINYRFYLKCK